MLVIEAYKYEETVKFNKQYQFRHNSTMARTSFSVATILVLANLVLISWAKPSPQLTILNDGPLIITRVDTSADHKTAIPEEKLGDSRFIGDLVVGFHRDDETQAQATFSAKNPTSEVKTAQVQFYAQGQVFHYLGLLNDEGSYLVACETPDTLGKTKAIVNIRVLPYSVATYTVYAGTHY